jgi:hypothetical protein
MGYGHYSDTAYRALATAKSYATKSREQIFVSQTIDPDMDPQNVIVRESRDSEEHPHTVAIIVGLDVTGSMGMVPESIVKKTLPDLMGTLLQAGVADPQVLFMGLGDFVYDYAPLQVGQFESSAELLDRWLTKVYLEGGGGGNNWESYNLAYLFAARHTAIDCWEKRQQKGFLFTMGDEPCASNIPADIIKRLTNAKQASTLSTEEILIEAQKLYHVYHFHIHHDSYSQTSTRKQGWNELLGDNFILLEDYQQVPKAMADLVIAKINQSQTNNELNEIYVEDML